jgi:RHS repeat-associated protein
VVKFLSEFAYDAQSRRTQKIDYSGWTNGAYSITNSTKFIYDGWNLISEISHTDTPTLSCSVTNFYVWGQDLSGSLQGAGGIGGLLAVIRFDTNSLQPTVYFPVYDGNGNITDYVNTNGVVVAHREYDPFGNTIVATGSMVKDFSFWFSTKYLDQETDLYYYGYRHYSPFLGRWLSRDPIGENSFNLIVSNLDVMTWQAAILNQQMELQQKMHLSCSSKKKLTLAQSKLFYDLKNEYIICLNNMINATDLLGKDINTPPSCIHEDWTEFNSAYLGCCSRLEKCTDDLWESCAKVGNVFGQMLCYATLYVPECGLEFRFCVAMAPGPKCQCLGPDVPQVRECPPE